MTLGLDLQGGSHILLQIEKQELIEERIVTTRDDIRRLLREKRIGYTGLTSRSMSLTCFLFSQASFEHCAEGEGVGGVGR